MALPTTNLTITDIKTVLGATTNKVSDLCTHPNINMWSRRKPVQDSRISVPLSEVGYANGSYGLVIPDWVRGQNQTWTYLPPIGGALSPYRLGDFRGYNHNAIPPISIQNYDGDTIGTNDTLTISAATSLSGGDQISLYDMNISDYYLAAEIEKDDGETLWGSYTNMLLPGDTSPQYEVKIKLSSLPSGWSSTSQLTVRLFLSNVQKRFGDTSIDMSQADLKAIHYTPSAPTTQVLNVQSGSTLDLNIDVTAMATSLNGPWTTIDNMGYSIGDTAFVTTGDLALKILIKGTGQFPYTEDELIVNPTYGGDTYTTNINVGTSGEFYDINGNHLLSSVTGSSSGVEAIVYFKNLLNRQNNNVFTPYELIEIVSSLMFYRPSANKNLGTLVKPFKNQ